MDVVKFPEVRLAVSSALPIEASQTFDLLERTGGVGGRDLPKSDEWEGLLARVETIREEAENRLDALLDRLNPILAADLSQVASSIAEPGAPILQLFGVNRFSWIVAVGGGGHGSDVEQLGAYFTNAARWIAASNLCGLLRGSDLDVSLSVSSNAVNEEIRRQASTEIRFAWVTELIMNAAAVQIEKDSARFGALGVTTRGVQQLFEFYRAAAPGALHLEAPEPGSAYEHAARLAKILSRPAGSMRGRGFKSLVLSIEMEKTPFVDYGHFISAVAIREAIFALELSLVARAKATLKDQKASSDLFELMIGDVLREVVSPDIAVPHPPLNIRLSNKDPGEIDFALLSNAETVLSIGEAKAKWVPTGSGTVVNAFKEQMSEAVTQLDKRLAAAGNGSPLRMAGGTAALTDECVGVAVPLHSYATAVWSRETLEEIGGARRDMIVVPLHQLVVLMQAIHNAEDLLRYRDFRWSIVGGGTQVADECDILVEYVAWRKDGGASKYASHSSGQVRFLWPREISTQVALLFPRPKDRDVWRAALMRYCTRLEV